MEFFCKNCLCICLHCLCIWVCIIVLLCPKYIFVLCILYVVLYSSVGVGRSIYWERSQTQTLCRWTWHFYLRWNLHSNFSNHTNKNCKYTNTKVHKYIILIILCPQECPSQRFFPIHNWFPFSFYFDSVFVIKCYMI